MNFPTIESFVGNTPLVRLQRFPGETSNTILGKLEGNNPAGSVKDRPALSMIRRAQERGEISAGGPADRGDQRQHRHRAGHGGRHHGLPDDADHARQHERRSGGPAMRAFGAEIILTPAAGSMEAAIDLARAMETRGEGKVLDQFANPDNPRPTTRAPVPRSGGTPRAASPISSVPWAPPARSWAPRVTSRSRIPPSRSSACSRKEDSKIPGIRRWPKEYLPKIYDPSLGSIGSSTWGKWKPRDTTRLLAAREGIFAGVSSGGAVAAALQLSREVENAVIVVIVCDRGDRYLSTGVFPD